MASWLGSFKPHVALIAVQVCLAGMNIITKVALDEGMNHLIFVAYTLAVATLAISPFAYFLERNQRPAMTCAIFWQIFVLALCGTTLFQNFYFAGLEYTSATFASATSNLVPVVTFAMATAVRLEKVDIRSKYGQAKVAGTIICVSGAMIMTFYKGPVLIRLNGVIHDTWLLGALMLFASCLFWSGWLTFQGPVVKKYPAEISLTAIMMLQGTVQCTLVALFFEPKPSAWRLKWDIQLLSIVYSGVLCFAFAFFVQTYCIRLKGPVFAAMFNPTSTIIVAVLEQLILHVKYYLGSLLGAILVISGLYIVLWGKAKDDKLVSPEKHNPADGSNNNISDWNIGVNQSLLQNEASHEHLFQSETEISR
jgi:drug/metabolite transporter (DMT)-like permease